MTPEQLEKIIESSSLNNAYVRLRLGRHQSDTITNAHILQCAQILNDRATKRVKDLGNLLSNSFAGRPSLSIPGTLNAIREELVGSWVWKHAIALTRSRWSSKPRSHEEKIYRIRTLYQELTNEES